MFVITGGGSGIGRALAIALAARNERVLVIGRRAEALQQTASMAPGITCLAADVADPHGQHAIIQALKNESSIQGLVHNAALIAPLDTLENITLSAWNQLMSVNVNAPLFLTQALLSKLQAGRVLMIGSGAAYFPVQGWAAYCVSKAALAMLTRCWQLEVDSVAFTSVMPGIIDTDMQGLIRNCEQMDTEKKQFFQRLKAEKRLLTPQAVALFLSWLLLDTTQADYVSQEWDIYDGKHHALWLKPPHIISPLD